MIVSGQDAAVLLRIGDDSARRRLRLMEGYSMARRADDGTHYPYRWLVIAPA